eukprot:9201467-Ditylum_brightwellii.AAC.1
MGSAVLSPLAASLTVLLRGGNSASSTRAAVTSHRSNTLKMVLFRERCGGPVMVSTVPMASETSTLTW